MWQIERSLQVLQNGYEHTGYDNYYNINLPISSLFFFFYSRDETAHNDIILYCDLHNNVILQYLHLLMFTTQKKCHSIFYEMKFVASL
jgi:hypothetical protein